MIRTPAISIHTHLFGVILSAALVAPVLASEPPKVSMTLQSAAQTDDSRYSIVFTVTNAGTSPALVKSCGCSFLPTNLPLLLSMFGQCLVPPGTNCAMRVSGRHNKPGPFWFRYAVFEPSSVFRKTEFAALRLKANVTGKAHYSDLWITNLWSPAYEITSPWVPHLSELPPALAAQTGEPVPWSLNFDCLAEPAQHDGTAKGSQPTGSQTNSPPSVPALPWLFRRGRSDMRDRTPPLPLATPDKPLAVALPLKVKFAA